jgi:hypothetical protein
MNRLALFLVLLGLCACTSRQDEANSVNDVWCVGEALDRYPSELQVQDLRNMGSFLKQFADQWAKAHDTTLQKEF